MTNIHLVDFKPTLDRRRGRGCARLREWSYILELLGETGDLVKLVEGVMIVRERSAGKGDRWRIYEVVNDRLKAHDIEGRETIVDFIDRSVGIEFYKDVVDPLVVKFEASNFCEVL